MEYSSSSPDQPAGWATSRPCQKPGEAIGRQKLACKKSFTVNVKISSGKQVVLGVGAEKVIEERTKDILLGNILSIIFCNNHV